MILVTGCAGFIGSRVVESLLRRGEEVLGIDNLNDSYNPRVKDWRLARFAERDGFVWRQLDITDRQGLGRLFDEHPFDAVINMAARAGVRQSTEDPWAYYATNVTGTLNLLELCRASAVHKFVLASTSSIYGASDAQPLREDALCDRPLSPYAASKKAAETLCHSYHHLYKLDVTILRYFTVYGPAGRPDMSIFRFVKWITEGETLILYGDGSQERDFTFVEDVAAGTADALKPVGFEVINIGSDHPVSINETIAKLERMLGRKAQIRQEPVQASDVPATWADISKAKRMLGWVPKTQFDDGLQQVVDWYAEHRAWAKDLL